MAEDFLFQYRFLNFPYKKAGGMRMICAKNMQKTASVFGGYVRQE